MGSCSSKDENLSPSGPLSPGTDSFSGPSMKKKSASSVLNPIGSPPSSSRSSRPQPAVLPLPKSLCPPSYNIGDVGGAASLNTFDPIPSPHAADRASLENVLGRNNHRRDSDSQGDDSDAVSLQSFAKDSVNSCPASEWGRIVSIDEPNPLAVQMLVEGRATNRSPSPAGLALLLSVESVS